LSASITSNAVVEVIGRCRNAKTNNEVLIPLGSVSEEIVVGRGRGIQHNAPYPFEVGTETEQDDADHDDGLRDNGKSDADDRIALAQAFSFHRIRQERLEHPIAKDSNLPNLHCPAAISAKRSSRLLPRVGASSNAPEKMLFILALVGSCCPKCNPDYGSRDGPFPPAT
jgi:hypothetical protein